MPGKLLGKLLLLWSKTTSCECCTSFVYINCNLNMSELEQQWLQQQLKKLLSFDDTIVESIADALVNATDEKHLASIFTVMYSG